MFVRNLRSLLRERVKKAATDIVWNRVGGSGVSVQYNNLIIYGMNVIEKIMMYTNINFDKLRKNNLRTKTHKEKQNCSLHLLLNA
jgi:hypothetical protein